MMYTFRVCRFHAAYARHLTVGQLMRWKIRRQPKISRTIYQLDIIGIWPFFK